MNYKNLFKRIKKEKLHLFWQPLAAILDLYLLLGGVHVKF